MWTIIRWVDNDDLVRTADPTASLFISVAFLAFLRAFYDPGPPQIGNPKSAIRNSQWVGGHGPPYTVIQRFLLFLRAFSGFSEATRIVWPLPYGRGTDLLRDFVASVWTFRLFDVWLRRSRAMRERGLVAAP